MPRCGASERCLCTAGKRFLDFLSVYTPPYCLNAWCGWQDFLICIEMLVFAIAHHKVADAFLFFRALLTPTFPTHSSPLL